MPWVFNKNYEPWTDPWRWEWGSPESFAGCHCRGHLRKSAPPAAPAHAEDRSKLKLLTFMSAAPHPRAQIDYTPISAGLSTDHMLMLYYQKHGTFVGAEVYITPNVNNTPGKYLYMSTAQPCDGRKRKWEEMRGNGKGASSTAMQSTCHGLLSDDVHGGSSRVAWRFIMGSCLLC